MNPSTPQNLADITGISMATAPGRAVYLPLGHKSGDTDLLGGGLLEGQIALRDAIALLKPLFQDASVLKVGQNVKYDYVVLARHGIERLPWEGPQALAARVATTRPELAALAARAAAAYVRLRYDASPEAAATKALHELEDCTRVLTRWRAPNRR